MGFSRQEYWSGLPFPSPGVLPNPETEPGSPAGQADALLSELLGKPHDTIYTVYNMLSVEYIPYIIHIVCVYTAVVL